MGAAATPPSFESATDCWCYPVAVLLQLRPAIRHQRSLAVATIDLSHPLRLRFLAVQALVLATAVWAWLRLTAETHGRVKDRTSNFVARSKCPSCSSPVSPAVSRHV